jgi:hypothetical protein
MTRGRPWSRRVLVAFAAIAAAAVVASCGGCVSMPLPPRPGAAESARVAAVRVPVVVGIEPDRRHLATEELVHCLRQTGLFASVGLLDRLDRPPDLLTRVEGTGAGAGVMPFFTVFSLGVIPTLFEERWGLAFSLRRPESSGPGLSIDARWRGRTILGWVSAVANLSPQRSSEQPTLHPRYAEHVAALLAAHSAEIDALLGPRPPRP